MAHSLLSPTLQHLLPNHEFEEEFAEEPETNEPSSETETLESEDDDDFDFSYFADSEVVPPPAVDVRSGNTGIDTLKLFFPLRLLRRPDFHILNRHEVRGRDVGEGYLWRDPQGKLAYGAMAVRRAGAFRFRIGPVGCETKLRVFFSASAVAYGHNARTITKDALRSVMEQMQETLRDLGVDVDWREGQVSRVDLHRDVGLPRPFHYYLAALQLIEPRYGRLFENYPTGVLRGAATRLVYSLYDKRAQCQARGTPLPPETNGFPAWLRCETRLPTAAAVRDALDVGDAGELIERFDGLSTWLDERIRKELLNEEVPDYVSHPLMTTPTFTPDDEMWWRAQLMGSSDEFKDRLCLVALRLAYDTIGQMRFWELAKQANHDGQLPVSKLRSQLRQTAMASFSNEMFPVAQLYQELRDALLTSTPAQTQHRRQQRVEDSSPYSDA